MLNKIKKVIIESIFEEIMFYAHMHTPNNDDIWLWKEDDNYGNWEYRIGLHEHILVRHYYKSKTNRYFALSDVLGQQNLYLLSIPRLLKIKKHLDIKLITTHWLIMK